MFGLVFAKRSRRQAERLMPISGVLEMMLHVNWMHTLNIIWFEEAPWIYSGLPHLKNNYVARHLNEELLSLLSAMAFLNGATEAKTAGGGLPSLGEI